VRRVPDEGLEQVEVEMGFLSEWRPFQGGLSRPSTIDDVFRETFRDFFAPVGPEGGTAMRFVPRVNVTEDEKAYELEVEVPGVKPEEVRVTITGDTLTIQGEKQREQQRQGQTWHVTERSYGSFQRSFTFPAAVDPESIEATSDSGVLKIRVAKAREAQPRRIEVRRGELAAKPSRPGGGT
jgi:HSP20 family protein